MGVMGRIISQMNAEAVKGVNVFRLYLVTDPDLCAGHGVVETVRDAVRGGVTIVQLRDKRAKTSSLVEIGKALRDVLASTGVPLIINDDVEAAIAIGADGIHVGQSDIKAEDVRKMVGPNMMIGLSCESVDDARAVDPEVVDYIGVSPVFATPTKTNHSGAVGLQGLQDIAAVTRIPKVPIGGIKIEHLSSLYEYGADGVAVVSAICGQPDVEGAARLLSDKTADVLSSMHGRAPTSKAS